MRRTISTTVALLTAVVALGAAPEGAAAATPTSVTIGGLDRSGGILNVSGTARFANQPPVQLGTDPAGDQAIPGTDALGKDVVAFSMATSTAGQLTLRWQLSQLAPAENRGIDVAYGRMFCAEPSEGPNCWLITFTDAGGAPTNSFVWGWKCADTSCSDPVHTLSYETDAYDATTKTASATVTLNDLGIAPGSRLVPVTQGGWGPVFVASPWWFEVGPGAAVYDTTGIDATYEVPAAAVSLAIGRPGQQPADVTYATDASLNGSGGFTGALDVSTLAPGAYTVYARACFGSNNCAYSTSDVTL